MQATGGIRTRDIVATLLAANTGGSIRCAMSLCDGPLPRFSGTFASPGNESCESRVGGGTIIVRPGTFLLRVAAIYSDVGVTERLIDEFGVAPTLKAAVDAAGMGRGHVVHALLRRCCMLEMGADGGERNGDAIGGVRPGAKLADMARAVWLRATWRDTSGRTAALLASLIDAHHRGPCPHTGQARATKRCVSDTADNDDATCAPAYPRCADDGETDEARCIDKHVAQALVRASEMQTPWWWYAARWGNVAVFRACAAARMAYCPIRAMDAAARSGRPEMCAWLVEHDADTLGVGPHTAVPDVDTARQNLAARIAIAAARSGPRSDAVLDWLRDSLGFCATPPVIKAIMWAALAPNESSAGTSTAAVRIMAIALPHAVLYAMRAWPEATHEAVLMAPRALLRLLRDAVRGAADGDRWTSVDGFLVIEDRVRRMIAQPPHESCPFSGHHDGGNADEGDDTPVNVWERAVSILAMHSADGLGNKARFVHDLRRLCACAVRCIDPSVRTATEDIAPWQCHSIRAQLLERNEADRAQSLLRPNETKGNGLEGDIDVNNDDDGDDDERRCATRVAKHMVSTQPSEHAFVGTFVGDGAWHSASHGATSGMWRRWCHPTPIPRRLLSSFHNTTFTTDQPPSPLDGAASLLAQRCIAWLDACGLVSDEP